MKSLGHFAVSLFLAITSISSSLKAQHVSPAETQECRQCVCLNSSDNRIAVGELERFRAAATNRWDQTDLKVVFVDGGGKDYAPIRTKIMKVARQWETFANIKFDFVGQANRDSAGVITDKNLDIAIQLEPSLFFRRGTYQSLYGPSAHSRTRAEQPAPSMWLVFPLNAEDDEIQRVTLHEFGHALGLLHEQKRPDVPIEWNRDAVLEYYRFTGWSAETIEEQVIKRFQGPVVASSPFDPTSIMIYPIPEGLANITADWTKSLSPMDKLFIGTIYPFVEIPAPREIQVGTESEIEIAKAGEIVSCRFLIAANGRYEVTSSGCPAVIGLMGSTLTGPLTHAAAAEGNPATFSVELKADSSNKNGDKPGTHYLYLRHSEGKTGTGKLKVQVRLLN